LVSDDTDSGTDSSESTSSEQEGRLKIQPGVIADLTGLYNKTIRVEAKPPQVECDEKETQIVLEVYHDDKHAKNPLRMKICDERSVHAFKVLVAEEINKVYPSSDPALRAVDISLGNDYEIFTNAMKCKQLVGKNIRLQFKLRGGAEPKLNLGDACEIVHSAMNLPTSVLQQEVNNTFPNFGGSCQSKIKEFQVKRPSLKSLEKSITVSEANLLKARQQIQASLQELYELCVVSAAKAAYLNSKKMESLHKKQHQQAKVELKLHQQQQLLQLQQQQQQQLQQPYSIHQEQEQQQCLVEEVSTDDDASV